MKICSVDNCEAKYFAKGLCHKHYDSVRRSTKEYKEQRTIFYRKYTEQNKTKIQELQREWRKKNPNYPAEWREKNRSFHNSKESKRRTIKAKNGVFKITKSELDKLYSSPCVNCGSTEKIHMDHIIPISRGGQHSIGNLQPLCASCNIRKSNKFMIEWKQLMKERG